MDTKNYSLKQLEAVRSYAKQQLRVLGFLLAFDESADWAPLSSFLGWSKLTTIFKKVGLLSTTGVRKESIGNNFNRKSISRKTTHPKSWNEQ